MYAVLLTSSVEEGACLGIKLTCLKYRCADGKNDGYGNGTSPI